MYISKNNSERKANSDFQYDFGMKLFYMGNSVEGALYHHSSRFLRIKEPNISKGVPCKNMT